MHELPIRGVSVVVARGGVELFAAGYGLADGEKRLAASPATMYPIGLITKTFTAAAILALRDRGKIALDTPISRYVPQVPHGSSISVATLLAQRSGLTDLFGDFAWEKRYQHASAAQMLETVRDYPLRFPPGTRFEYSNTNYLLLGMALERAADEPYIQALHRYVIEPAGIKQTMLAGDQYVAHAVGYQRQTNASGAPIDIPDGARMFWGAGGLASSARDLALFDAALFDGRILRSSSVDEMIKPASQDAEQAYAMGWFVDEVNGVSRIRHGGNVPGFSSANDVLPSRKLSVCVLCNLSRINAEALADRIDQVLVEVPDAHSSIF